MLWEQLKVHKLVQVLVLIFLFCVNTIEFSPYFYSGPGLAHLHNLVPPLLHMYFRTSNVLLDENFTAKVSDYGLTKLLVKGHHAGSSSAIDYFLDPEYVISLTKVYMFNGRMHIAHLCTCNVICHQQSRSLDVQNGLQGK